MSAPTPYYAWPATSEMPVDVQAALVVAYTRWYKAAAVRIEEPNTGIAVFRPRYRVGVMKAANGVALFIEHGAGDTWVKAFEDVDLREKVPAFT